MQVRLTGTLGPSWTLDGLALEVDRETRLDKNPRTGDRVEVRGTVSRTGNVRATRIRKR